MLENLIGQKFNKLTVVSQAPSRNGARMWKCQCECGNFTEVSTTKLKNGHTKSCGCLLHKSSFKDLTGQKFERLTVLSYGGRDNTNKIMWNCRCDCGTEKVIRGSDLTQGRIKSCGCLHSEMSREKILQVLNNKRESLFIPEQDLTNQQFSRLTVISLDQELSKQQKRAYWNCLCSCGNSTKVSVSNLLGGHTKSCGCLQKEIAANNMKMYAQPKSPSNDRPDLSGQKFGKLIAIELDWNRIEQDPHKHSYWRCRCDCGQEKTVAANSLISGLTQSCGCLGNSLGQSKIIELLQKYNYNFNTEVSFIDLIDVAKLRFDFGVYDDNNKLLYLIEYDGRQHSDTSSIWYTEDLIKKDEMKNQYCKNNNIPLIRIPYTHFNALTIEDLELNSTKFLI